MRVLLALVAFVAVATAQWNGNIFPIGGTNVQASQTYVGTVGSNPAVAWVSCPSGTCNGSIRYAIAAAGTPPSSYTTYTVVSTGLVNVASIAFTNLNGTGVAFAWADRTTATGNVRYINSANSAGTSFAGIPSRIVQTYNNDNASPGYVDIFTVNGRPTVMWTDSNTGLNGGAGTTRFKRALDQNGNTWPTTPTEATNHRSSRIECASFTQTGNNVRWYCVASVPTATATIRFLTANDVNASGFTAQGAFTPALPATDGAIMRLASGFPAVCYYSTMTANAVHFRAGSNLLGTTFSADVTAKAATSTGGMSCANIGGNPAIAYQVSSTTAGIQYIRSSTATGIAAADWSAAAISPSGNYALLRNGLTLYSTSSPQIWGRRVTTNDIFTSINGVNIATTATTTPATTNTAATSTVPSAAGALSVSGLLVALVLLVATLF